MNRALPLFACLASMLLTLGCNLGHFDTPLNDERWNEMSEAELYEDFSTNWIHIWKGHFCKDIHFHKWLTDRDVETKGVCDGDSLIFCNKTDYLTLQYCPGTCGYSEEDGKNRCIAEVPKPTIVASDLGKECDKKTQEQTCIGDDLYYCGVSSIDKTDCAAEGSKCAYIDGGFSKIDCAPITDNLKLSYGRTKCEEFGFPEDVIIYHYGDYYTCGIDGTVGGVYEFDGTIRIYGIDIEIESFGNSEDCGSDAFPVGTKRCYNKGYVECTEGSVENEVPCGKDEYCGLNYRTSQVGCFPLKNVFEYVRRNEDIYCDEIPPEGKCLKSGKNGSFETIVYCIDDHLYSVDCDSEYAEDDELNNFTCEIDEKLKAYVCVDKQSGYK